MIQSHIFTSVVLKGVVWRWASKSRMALLVICVATAWASAGETIDVFFAGGQSNAKLVWANAIQNTLTNSGEFSNPLVVHATKPGASLNYWYQTGPEEFYDDDFFNHSGTGPMGVLESALDSIVNNGDTYNFRGFFWFQGESDCRPEFAAVYEERLLNMMDQVKTDIGMSSSFPYSLAVVDMDPDPFWDDPSHVYGITRQGVEALRAEQFDLGNLPNGSYVDTRGIPRIPFTLIPGVTDAWHLDAQNLTLVGNQMAEEFIANVIPEPTSMIALLGGGILCLLRKRSRQR